MAVVGPAVWREAEPVAVAFEAVVVEQVHPASVADVADSVVVVVDNVVVDVVAVGGDGGWLCDSVAPAAVPVREWLKRDIFEYDLLGVTWLTALCLENRENRMLMNLS